MGKKNKSRKSPTLYTFKSLNETINSNTQSSHNGKDWVPARPDGFPSLKNRIKIAWKVFLGDADAIIWPGGQ